MFDWFRKYGKSKGDVATDMTNVLPFPEPKLVTPAHEEPTTEKDNSPCYQVGKTADGRVTLRLGDSYSYSQLTMNDAGVDGLIEMLLAAKSDSDD